MFLSELTCPERDFDFTHRLLLCKIREQQFIIIFLGKLLTEAYSANIISPRKKILKKRREQTNTNITTNKCKLYSIHRYNKETLTDSLSTDKDKPMLFTIFISKFNLCWKRVLLLKCPFKQAHIMQNTLKASIL